MQVIVQNAGYCPCCRTETTFRAEDAWLRDAYVCLTCGSIPRQRHLQAVLDSHFPNWEHLVVHESSPSNDFVSARCRQYSSSQYLPEVPLGSDHHGVRCESIEDLTFADESIDIFITQDVLEHVFHPDRAIREIARVLRPGGAHVFTVPVHPALETTICRAKLVDGAIHHLLPENYHASPVGDHRALVTFDYGRDFPQELSKWADGASVEVIHTVDRGRGLDAEHLEVYVVRKQHSLRTSQTSADRPSLREYDARDVVEGRSTARVSMDRLATVTQRAGSAAQQSWTIVAFGANPAVRSVCEMAPRHRVVHIDPRSAQTSGDQSLPPGLTSVPPVVPTPLGVGAAALIVSGDTFEQLTAAEREAWAAEVSRLLGPDGILTLDAAPDSRRDVEALWGRYGLQIIDWVPPGVLSRRAFVVLSSSGPRWASMVKHTAVKARRIARRAINTAAARLPRR